MYGKANFPLIIFVTVTVTEGKLELYLLCSIVQRFPVYGVDAQIPNSEFRTAALLPVDTLTHSIDFLDVL